MKDKRKIGIIVTIVVMLLTVFGITYAFYNYVLTGNRNSVLVTGDIYMNYTESNQINLENAIPMSKEEALKLSNNIFNFTITGKNQSSKDIYYGISIVYGGNQDGKTRLKDEDIDVYLTSGEDVLINANRYKTLDDTRIWVEKINANTETYTKDYSLRMWVDEGVTIGNQNVDYTNEAWNNSYASFKVKVDGNLNEMNVPLEVDYQKSYYENGKTYFMVSISNYLNPSEKGISLASADTMKLDITTTNKDIVFTYQDDAGNKSEDGQNLSSITQTYTFEENKKVKMQVFVNSKNDIDIKTDINIKLSKNDEENYEILKYMHIKGAKDYCKNNGFSNFADCLLVSEQLSNTVEEAKDGITKKGEIDTSKTAPVISYAQTAEVSGVEIEGSRGDNFWNYADSYSFDPNTGKFTLTDNIMKDQKISSAMIGKYTVGTSNYSLTQDRIYRVTSIQEEENIAIGDMIKYEITNSLGSEVGLYKTVDNDGDTYYYRGDVKNNNVKFGGFYWKIVRINGDGSIRLIYNGDHANATGQETSVNGKVEKFNKERMDPTYVGYMYGNDFSKEPIRTSTRAYYSSYSPTIEYWFSKAYNANAETRTFSLGDDKIKSTLGNLNSKLREGYKYTCRLTDADGTCQFLIEVSDISGTNSTSSYYITYSSTSYEKTLEDKVSSNAKITLENWYTNTFALKNENGSNVINFININATYCNDRTFYKGDGFSFTPATYYGASDRLDSKKKPSLICPQERDLFSIKGSSGKGNKKLEKPIGLLTADEFAFAGGLYNEKNEKNYLYNNFFTWTMSPAMFSDWDGGARNFYIAQDGAIVSNNYVSIDATLRAVINLKKDVLLAGGNGTMEDPYTVKIAS